MLLLQQRVKFSAYSSLYDLIIPKENLLRKINDMIDFSFVYDELECPAGHIAIRKARTGKRIWGKINLIHTILMLKSVRDGCYKEGAKTKTYSVTIKSDRHKEQIAFQQTEYIKEKAKHRYKIEAKNGALKNVN